MFLESYICPVCLFSNDTGKAMLKRLLGTAFFIGHEGYFLTAGHVLNQAFEEASKCGYDIGLVVKGDNGQSPGEYVSKLEKYEFAPKPYDIATGWLPYRPISPLKIEPTEVHMWQEIAAVGYPESAFVIDGEARWMNLRGYRGYVQRTVSPRDRPAEHHPNGLELSFLLSPGSSGAPIFTIPKEVLVGVGIRSYKSEYLDDEITDVDEHGRGYREKRVRIEQFGFAHDISGLLDWRAEIFAGRSLPDIATVPV